MLKHKIAQKSPPETNSDLISLVLSGGSSMTFIISLIIAS